MDGVLNTEKPAGWTSHDVVMKIRRITGEAKVGHTGTLDPLATGVLLLCLGKATKIAQYLTHENKEYVATLKLGVTTDTLDADGVILTQRTVNVTRHDVQNILPSFQGEIEQTPPMFSAIKHEGKRLYQLARCGKTVDRATRRVHIFCIELLEYDNGDVKIRVECSKGTYIRSLAYDIGEKLGCGAHVVALQRTRVGRFQRADSLSMETIEHLMARGLLQKHVMSINDALDSLPVIKVDAEGRRRFEKGASVIWKNAAPVQPWDTKRKTIRIVDSENTFVGLGTIECSTSQKEYNLIPIRVLN